MCSVLCGIDQLEEIVSYGNNKLDFLRKTFSIEKIPSKPTLSRVLNIIVPDEVSTKIIEIMREHVSELGEIVAVDGNAIRSTSTKGKAHSALQILTAYCTESGVVIYKNHIAKQPKKRTIKGNGWVNYDTSIKDVTGLKGMVTASALKKYYFRQNNIISNEFIFLFDRVNNYVYSLSFDK